MIKLNMSEKRKNLDEPVSGDIAKKKATNTPLECGVCQEDFDEDERCPRILLCTHYLCASCINQLIETNSKICPFCKIEFEGSSSEDFMENRALLDMIKFMSAQNPTSKILIPDNAASHMESTNCFKGMIIATMESHIANYENLKGMSENSIKSMDEIKFNICQQCDEIENAIINPLREMIQRNKKLVSDLAEKQSDLSCSMEEIKKKQMLLKDLLQRLDEMKTFKEAGTLLDEAGDITVSEWAKTYKARLRKEEEILEAVTKDKISADVMVNSIQKTLRFGEGYEEYANQVFEGLLQILKEVKGECFEEYIVDALVQALKEEKDECFKECIDFLTRDFVQTALKRHISINTLQRKWEPFIRLLKHDRMVAVQKQNGITRSAPITLKKNKIYVHHLKEELPPQNAFTLKHEELLSLVDPSSRVTFLTLGKGDATLGQLLIRLAPDSKRTRNFFLLCTGEKGPSYANTKMIGRLHNYCVRGGDYQFNNGMGGKPLISGLIHDLLKEGSKVYMERGSVYAHVDNDNVHFCICYESSHYSISCPLSFGKVEQGIEILDSAILPIQNINNIKVLDCGFVLPYVCPSKQLNCET